jgi:hypothetical protein
LTAIITKPASIRLDFFPQARLLTATREFVTSFYSSLSPNTTTSSRLALAAHELMENAVKYSSDGAATLALSLAHRGEEFVLSVSLSNRASVDHRRELERLVEEVSGAPDAMMLYLKLMRKNARNPETSGLGLARIRAEAELSVSCTSDGDIVTILAQGPLRGQIGG